MSNTTKFFVATTIILACALGFFGGCFFSCPRCCGPKSPCPMNQMMMQNAPMHHAGKGGIKVPRPHEMPMQNAPMHPEKFHGEKHHKGWFSPEAIDSALQITAEQKEALEAHRNSMDTKFKELRHQKMDAEKTLKIALDNNDSAQINAAKAAILTAQEAILDERIAGVASLNKILSKEQQEKFRNFEKERFNKFKEKHDRNFER